MTRTEKLGEQIQEAIGDAWLESHSPKSVAPWGDFRRLAAKKILALFAEAGLAFVEKENALIVTETSK